MKDTPDIIKLLRKEEELGMLTAQKSSTTDTFQIPPPQDDASTMNQVLTSLNNSTDQFTSIDKTELYKILFETSSIAVTIADEQERIVSWNTQAEKLLNMTQKDLYKKPVKSLYPEEEWQKIRNENVRKKGIKYRMETKMLNRKNELLNIELSLCMLRSGSGRNVGTVGIIKDISELKHIEKKFLESEHKYKTIFENSAVAIMLTDENENIISWNSYTEYLLNTDEQNLKNRPVHTLYPDEEWQKIRKQNIRQKGMQHHLETKIFTKDNKTIDVDLSLSVLRNHKGEIIGSIGIIKDITTQKRIQQQLEKSERQFKLLYDRAPVSYHILSPEGTITNVNQKWCQTLGYTKQEVIGKSIFDFIEKKEQKEAQKSFKRKLTSKKTYSQANERTYLTKNGEKRTFVIHDFFSFTTKEAIDSIFTIMEDVTNRKQAEQHLKESEKKYRTIFNLSPESIILTDEKGTIIDANDRIQQLIKYHPNELINCNINKLAFLSQKSKNIMQTTLEQQAKGITTHPFEIDLLTKEGAKKIGMTYSTPVKNSTQDFIGSLIAISDITQQKMAWEKMVKSEEKYRVLAETSADGVFSTDVLGRLTYVNPSLEQMLGRRKSQILATPFRDYLSENSIYLFQQALLDVRKQNKKVSNIRLDVLHKEGYEVPIEANIAPLKKEGKFIGIECTIRDVSEREKIVRELKKSENLRTEFMNIVAHELKSPVTPIKGYLDLIATSDQVDEKTKNWAHIGLRNAERLLSLVNDILDVSRLDTDTMRFNMEHIDITEILNDVTEDIKPAIEMKNLKFNKKMPQKIPTIYGDKYRLLQVLKNLLGNAIKFTDYGSIGLDVQIKDKNLQIRIEDTGIGISPDETKKIFTKFYQAYTGDDRKNEGTGLGLFICKEIIKKHRGDIWAESKVGKGTKFTISLPISHQTD